MAPRTTRVFLERYEGDLAVFLLGPNGETVFHLPRALVPGDAPEGTVLDLSLAVDEAATRAARDEVAALLEDLSGSSDGSRS